MAGLVLKNFKGIFEKGSKFDLPDVFAETCKDWVLTHEGMLKKRNGYALEYLGATGTVNILNGIGANENIINMFELVTGRSETTAPNEAVKYLCQTDYGTGRIYYWNESTKVWVRIDNSLTNFTDAAGVVRKCVWLEENGAARILAGNRSVNKPLWWGWCGQRFAGAILDNNRTVSPINGAFLSTAAEAKVPQPVFSTNCTRSYVSHASWTNSNIGTNKYVTYKIALQYDYKQWSTASDVQNYYNVAWLSPASPRTNLLFTFPSTYDRRITGIKLYRKIVDNADWFKNTGSYYLLKQVDMNETFGDWTAPTDHIWPYNREHSHAFFNSATLKLKVSDTLSTDDILVAGLYDNCLLIAYDSSTGIHYTCRIASTYYTAADDQGFVLASGTSLVNAHEYAIKVVTGWQRVSGNYTYGFVDDVLQTTAAALPEMYSDLGITAESLTDSNPKYGVMINGQAFYGNVYNNGETKEYLVTYGMLTSDGLYANDVHSKLNAFSAGRPVKSMSATGNRLLIYGDSFIARGIIPSGNEASWTYEKLFDKFGLLAEYSLVNINGKDYFLSTDWDIKVFDGIVPPASVGGGIYDTIRRVGAVSETYLRNAIGFFVPKLNVYGIRFQTGANSYEYWLYDISNQLGWFQFEWKTTLTGFFNTRFGDSIGYKQTGVYKLNSGTKDGSTAFVPVYKSLPFAASRDSLMNIESLAYHIKSDTEAVVQLYVDDAVSPVVINIPANALDKLQSYPMPMGTLGRSLQIGVSISIPSSLTNALLEVDDIELPLKASGDQNG